MAEQPTFTNEFLKFIHLTKTQAIMGFTFIFLVCGLLKWGKFSDAINNRLLDMLYLVPAFYFIASKSGDKKDETIASLSANQVAPTVDKANTVNVNTDKTA